MGSPFTTIHRAPALRIAITECDLQAQSNGRPPSNYSAKPDPRLEQSSMGDDGPRALHPARPRGAHRRHNAANDAEPVSPALRTCQLPTAMAALAEAENQRPVRTTARLSRRHCNVQVSLGKPAVAVLQSDAAL